MSQSDPNNLYPVPFSKSKNKIKNKINRKKYALDPENGNKNLYRINRKNKKIRKRRPYKDKLKYINQIIRRYSYSNLNF
jgi:hypothetical protein